MSHPLQPESSPSREGESAVVPDPRVRDFLEAAPDAIVIVDGEGRITRVNARAEEMFGYSRGEMVGEPVELLLPDRLTALHVTHRDRYLQQPVTRPMGRCTDLLARRRDGTELPVEVSLSPTMTDAGPLVISIIRDITWRQQAEAAQRFLAAIVESSDDAIIGATLDGTILSWNQGAQHTYGYTSEEVVGEKISLLCPKELKGEGLRLLERIGRGERIRRHETVRLRKDGKRVDVSLTVSPVHDANGSITGASIIARDISEQKRGEVERARLLASEQEKSEQLRLVVREAHHRIKNNLQSISDLLYLELHAGEGSPPAEALRESMERIQAIALVHDLLSHEADVQSVDARAVAERLVPVALASNGLPRSAVKLEIEVASVALSSKKATTLALILNELVTNAAKHALAGRDDGWLEVRLEEAEDGLRLQVNDDGPGLPPDFDLSRDANVGLEVVRTLAERDLNGRFTLKQDGGLRAEVWFPW